MDSVRETFINKRYRLDEEIGRGGMGVVYRAWDTLLQRDVAIKVLNQDTLGSGGSERLLNEARVVARLDHPNIVTVFDAGQLENSPFIVMQHVVGETVADLKPVEQGDIFPIAIQICSALAHAHENGIIHRDLKPENIFLVQPEGDEFENSLRGSKVKIVDFGVAHSETADLTIHGEILGSVSYMAPEQALGEATSPQTDLYALGVILYELAAGELPFAGDDPLSVLSQHIHAPVKPPSSLNPQIIPELDDLILGLMSKKPADRPSSAHDVEQGLRGLSHPDVEGATIGELLDTSQRVKHNLPVQLTSFVGREDEIDDLSQLLKQDTCRLLTLIGPGGIGKTRLAIEVAAHNLPDYRDGAFFISLASVPSPDFILTSIAEALGLSLQTQASVDPENQLFDYLAQRQTLLVLDNYEHLIDGTGVITDLLKKASGVNLLVTTRQKLDLQGEWLFYLSGLTYPENGQPGDGINSSAVNLFVERAKLADAKIKLSAEEMEHVIRICQLVEGIPLGIELASAWAAMLSPREIAAEIEKNLDFLSSSRHDLPEKHRSMRAAFDHSWQLLPENQRVVFRKLSVFTGGFSRQAAELVASTDLFTLSALVEKSFVRREESGRYQVHELLRQYGEEKLTEDKEELIEIGRHHFEYFLAFLYHREQSLIGEGQLVAKDEVLAEIDNIRTAIKWGIIHHREEEVRSALEILFDFYFMQGYYEGVETYKNFARMIEDQYQPGFDPAKTGCSMYLSALANQAFYLSMLGAVGLSDELSKKIHPGLLKLDLQTELMVCLLALGINCSWRGEYEPGEKYLQEAILIGEKKQDQVGLGAGKIWLGWIYYESGDPQSALREWQEAEDISREMNNRLLLAFVQSKLALLGEETGGYEEAIKIQLEARENFKRFNDQVGVGYATTRLTLSLMGIGEYREAKRFGQEGYESFKEMNHRWGVPASLCRIGFAEIGLGEFPQAWDHFKEALALSQKGGITTLMLYSLVGIGSILAREEQIQQGVEILSFVLANPLTPALYRQITERELSDLEQKIPREFFDSAKVQGETSELEQILKSIPESLDEGETA